MKLKADRERNRKRYAEDPEYRERKLRDSQSSSRTGVPLNIVNIIVSARVIYVRILNIVKNKTNATVNDMPN